MARKREPDVKVGKILDAAERLFAEKGYENTTIADIQNGAGVSRGAIYHHFPVNAKEEIISALTVRMYHNTYGYDAGKDEGLNSLGKFRSRLLHTYQYHNIQDLFLSSAALLKNPKYLSQHFIDCIEFTVPAFIEAIDECNRDGSANVSNVIETAEMIALLLNTWCIPAIFPGGKEQLIRRFKLLGEQAAALGLPFMNDELMEAFRQYAQRYAE